MTKRDKDASSPNSDPFAQPDSIGARDTTAPDPDAGLVVGVGASAGGVEALKAFLRTVPEDLGMALVVVLHLAPDSESRLTSVLQTITNLPVETATDGTDVFPNRVYVIPPGQRLTIENRRLHLSASPDRHDATTIDGFFRSLAHDQETNAVGMLLSGTGTDGTMGLRTIREAGGFTMAQAPADAAYAEMPQHAIAADVVDVVHPVADMADAMVRYRDRDKQVSQALPSPDDTDAVDLSPILRHLSEQTDQDFSLYKPAMILRRLRRRIRIAGVETLAEYERYLKEHEKEVDALRQDLLIGVTSFFRNPEAFEALLGGVVPKLMDDKSTDDIVRIWVLGCATGEEAYSLAILFLEYAHTIEDAPALQIFATDVNEQAVRIGREGLYPRDIRENVDAERLDRFFLWDGDRYQVTRRLRETVLFARHNILKDPPFSNLDLISCRNLLIYLNRESQERVLQLLHYGLRANGFLFLGRSEAGNRLPKYFSAIDKKAKIFQAREISTPPPIPNFPGQLPSPQVNTITPPSITQSVHLQRANKQEALHRRLFMNNVASVLVDQRYDIVHLSGGVDRFLRFQGGSPTPHLLSCVSEGLRSALRNALDVAFNQGRSSQRSGIHTRIRGADHVVALRVSPVTPISESQSYAHVRFIDQMSLKSRRPEAADNEIREVELEEELDRMHEQLQTTAEEYATAATELESAYEELLSMNEELQSKNEELQTSKEELQSLNEELKTTNQALEQRVEEARQANNDLENLIAATEIATLFLDTELRIQQFTPPATRLFSIRPEDIGRPLADFTHRFRYEGIFDDARRVLDNGDSIEQEVRQGEDTWYLMRLRPYRTAETDIEGVVVTFVDITERRQLEREVINASEEMQQRIGQDLHDMLASRLTGTSMLLQNLRNRVANPDVTVEPEEVSSILKEVHEAANESRNLSHVLIPVALEQQTLPEALSFLAEQMDDLHAPTIRYEQVGDEPVIEDPGVAMHLYRIALEAIQNAIKHAEATTIVVTLSDTNGNVQVGVRDDGSGLPDDVEEGLGIRSIRRRTDLLEGRFSLTSNREGGTSLQVMIDSADGAER